MSNPVRYHLRVPFNSTFSAAEEDATFDVLSRGDIDEAMFFVPNLEERCSGMQTIETCRRCADRLAPIFDRARSEGVVPSINFYWTASFSDFPSLPRDHRDTFDFRWAMRQDGHLSHVVACPQDEAWRAHTREMYGIFAALKPTRVWIDDDLRMTFRADMYDACFCDVCVGEMARRTGQPIARTELSAAILAAPPNAIRDAWLEFQDDIACDVIAGLSAAVRDVSPETQTCLMHSSYEIHAAEGRHWDRIIDALGGDQPYFRPPIGPYYEATPITYTADFNCCRLMRAVVPEHVEMVPEIENYPQSRFMTSTTSVRLHLLWAQLLGMRETTLSTFRYGGRIDLEIAREDPWSGLLRELKPYLQSIADLGIKQDQFRGVSMYYNERVCHHTRDVTDMSKVIFLYRRRPLDYALPLLGIATRYDGNDLTVFAGEHVACLSDDERRDAFSGGVLLDGRAAETLLLGGHGALAGLSSAAGETGASQETIEDAEFGFVGDPINLRWEGAARQFEWTAGARTISVLRDYDGNDTGHGIVLFENELGGRVAVIPYDSQVEIAALGYMYESMCTPGFLSFPRQAQLKAVFEWMNRGPLPLFVPDAPSVSPLLIQQDDRLIVSITNLMSDPVPNLRFELGVPGVKPIAVKHLQTDGTWMDMADATIETAENGAVVVRTSITASHLDPVVLVVETETR